MGDWGIRGDEDDWPGEEDTSIFLCASCYRPVTWPDVLCDACERCTACGSAKEITAPCESCGGGWYR